MKDPDEVFRSDLVKTLITWGILEVLCFWLMPFVKAIEYERISHLLMPTVVAGIAGSFIVAFAGRALVQTELTMDARAKARNRRFLQILSLLGLGLAALPFFIGAIEFSHSIASYDWENWGKPQEE
ncbi:MAG: hypothetical protein Q6K99_09665 [Thermostichales cyanobacterium BF4_bins_65]